MKIGLLNFQPATESPELLGPSVFRTISAAAPLNAQGDFFVAKIEPQYAGGVELCNYYNIDPSAGANCLIVEARRGDRIATAACVVPVGNRYDLGGVVRRKTEARQVSVAPLEAVLKETQMELGSITPIGLPPSWQIFIDPEVIKERYVVMGSGLVTSKLLIWAPALLHLPNVQILEGLAKAPPASQH